MSIIIRLQNLPWTGSALDIRRFFVGLQIPDGGVHIIGGDKGEAFVGFASDEDARKSMMLNGQCIGDAPIQLFLSSKMEMQNSIAVARGLATSVSRPHAGGDAPFGSSTGPLLKLPGVSHGESGSGFSSAITARGMKRGQGEFNDERFSENSSTRAGLMIQRIVGPFSDGSQNLGFSRDERSSNWDDGDRHFRRVVEGNQRNQGDDYDNYPMDTGYDGRKFGQGTYSGGRPHSDFDDRPQLDRDYDLRDDFQLSVGRKRGYNSDTCVVVSNLPFSVSFKDVRRLFRGLEIPRDGLKLLNNEMGERLGVAYVRFSSHMDARNALLENGSFAGDNRIIIEPCSDVEFEDAIDSYVPSNHLQPQYQSSPPMARQLPFRNRMRSTSPPNKRFAHEKSLCVCLKGLPLGVKKIEVREFVKPMRLERNLDGIVLDVDRSGKRTNIVYVEFEGKRDFELSRQLSEKKFLGAFIEVSPVPKSTFIEALKRARAFEKDVARRKTDESKNKLADNGAKAEDINGSKDGTGTTATNNGADKDSDGGYCVKMDGLPFSATSFNVREFFSGLTIVEKGCHIMLNRENKAAGFAFVEFATEEDRNKALEKDSSHMGHRYITITSMTRNEMLQTIEHIKRTRGQTDTADLGKARCVIAMDNVHFRATEDDVFNFFHQLGILPTNIRIHCTSTGRPIGKATATFRSAQECQRVVRELNATELMGRHVVLTLTT